MLSTYPESSSSFFPTHGAATLIDPKPGIDGAAACCALDFEPCADLPIGALVPSRSSSGTGVRLFGCIVASSSSSSASSSEVLHFFDSDDLAVRCLGRLNCFGGDWPEAGVFDNDAIQRPTSLIPPSIMVFTSGDCTEGEWVCEGGDVDAVVVDEGPADVVFAPLATIRSHLRFTGEEGDMRTHICRYRGYTHAAAVPLHVSAADSSAPSTSTLSAQ